VRFWRCVCLRIPAQANSSWERPQLFEAHQVVHRPQDRPSCLFAHTYRPLPCSALPFQKVTLRNHYRSDPRQHGLGMVAVQSNTYLLTRWSRVLLEKLTGSTASQEIPRIFGTRMFLTVLTSARHLSLSWANSIQSPQTPPTSWRSILILSSHLRLGLPFSTDKKQETCH
jgi:hypothetical protein